MKKIGEAGFPYPPLEGVGGGYFNRLSIPKLKLFSVVAKMLR